jgi:putative peptidoglycan lipid II flippase
MVIAALFGASRNMDAFLTAFRAPNMLRDLFAEGALSTAFVTTFSRRIATEGDQSAWRLASKVATLTLVFMSAITLLGILFAPSRHRNSRARFSRGKSRPNDLLTRIMFPFILLVSLAALVMGMLNAKHVFGSGDGFELFQYRLDRRRRRRCATGLTRNRTGGIRISASADWSGSRWNSSRRSPAIAGSGSLRFAQRFSFPIRLRLARSRRAHHPRFDGTGHDRGQRRAGERGCEQWLCLDARQRSDHWLNIAFASCNCRSAFSASRSRRSHCRSFSRSAALGNTQEFRGALAHAMRLVMLLTIPSAIGLIILAEPIIRLIYQHGRFTAAATVQTAGRFAFLCDRAGRLRGGESARAGFLCAR